MHVSIIMDGNGRWAQRRGLPRVIGHREGVKRAEEIIRAAPDLGISVLTLYAFSTENWKRPKLEISAIFKILEIYLRAKIREMVQEGVRIRFVGGRDRFPKPIIKLITQSEKMTAHNTKIILNICLDYGGRDEIVRTTRRIAERVLSGTMNLEEITEAAFADESDFGGQEEPSLVLRTGGDHRLSNFLLWHCAYSEFCFTDKLWPDFHVTDLVDALQNFNLVERRFGGVVDKKSS